MSPAKPLAVLALGLALAACGGAAAPAGAPSVDVGTGIDQFVAIADGDDVPIIMGPQGGYHIWGSVQAHNLALHDAHLRFSITRDGDPEPLTTRNDVVDLTEISANFGQFLGSAVFLPDPTEVRGQPCHFEIDVDGEDGRSATATRRIVPR